MSDLGNTNLDKELTDQAESKIGSIVSPRRSLRIDKMKEGKITQESVSNRLNHMTNAKVKEGMNREDARNSAYNQLSTGDKLEYLMSKYSPDKYGSEQKVQAEAHSSEADNPQALNNISGIDLDFKKFKIAKFDGISKVKVHIRKALYKADTNEEERKNVINVLTSIQEIGRTKGNFKEYKKVINSAKYDDVILRALEKLEHENDITSIDMDFEKFKIAKFKGIKRAKDNIKKVLEKTDTNEKERKNAMEILEMLKNIQKIGRTDENFNKYKKVINSAKYDNSIFTALEKLEYYNDV